jgi:hypothetical protein
MLSWLEAALVCKSFEMNEQLLPLLEKLRRSYKRLEMHEELDNFEEEWSS